ncbi:hypothetical protein [Candidatus Enterovibrio altilux]|nr:hypothetical protein [Candidatus Enterovibrio luxaltus]
MVRIKNYWGGTLSLRNQTTQISKIDAIIKALNKLIRLSIPNTKTIV